MRFFATLVAALPALAAAQDFQQYQAQFQNFLGNLGSYVPNPARHDPIAALEAKTGSLRMHTLTLENWRETFYEPVLAPKAKIPQEWWVLISGRNKTCFGRCDNIEQAFNETAGKFALTSNSPHMAYLNCDDQPILCNSWSVTAGNLWAFQIAPPPANVEIWQRRLNLTSTTSEDFSNIHKVEKKFNMKPLDSWFDPFHGKAHELGLAVPFGWIVWAFGLIPNWLFMLSISMFSRSFMGNRMRPQEPQRAQRPQ